MSSIYRDIRTGTVWSLNADNDWCCGVCKGKHEIPRGDISVMRLYPHLFCEYCLTMIPCPNCSVLLGPTDFDMKQTVEYICMEFVCSHRLNNLALFRPISMMGDPTENLTYIPLDLPYILPRDEYSPRSI